MNKVDKIVSSLLLVAEEQGYLLFDDILDISDENDLSVSEVDQISEQITLRGILLYEEQPHEKHSAEIPKQEYYDYSHIDYEDIYKEVCIISPNLKILVDTIKKIIPPQRGEIIYLTELIRNGNEYARERLINSQLRVALKLALNLSKAHSYDLEDTVSAAFIGLVIATDKFDPTGFSTFQAYASWWIQAIISRECSPVWMEYYYPVHYRDKMIPTYEKYLELLKASAYLEKDIPKIISEEKEIPIKDVIKYIKSANTQKKGKLSYEVLLEDETSILYSDKFVVNEKNEITHFILREAINNLLTQLNPREAEIITERYGLNDGVWKTLEEVGKKYGITRERVRQIESKALRKLSTDKVKKRLKEYYYHTW